MNDFCKKFDLDVSHVNKFWSSALHDLNTEFDKIFDLQSLEIFSYTKDKLINIRNQAIKDPDNLIYCYLLRQAFINRNSDAINALGSPNSRLNDELYDTLPLFSLLSLVPNMISHHQKLGIPEVITRATLGMFENQIQESIYVLHKFGIAPYTSWMSKFLYSEIIRIGRLNFEICKFNKPCEAYLSKNKLFIIPNGVPFHKNGYVLGSIGCEDDANSFYADITKNSDNVNGYLIENGICKNVKIHLEKPIKILSSGDLIVNVHIPFDGPLTAEMCDRDFTLAEEIIGKCYGDFSAFACYSWLLDPQLKKIAGKNTNITDFAERFHRFPVKSDGGEVFEYVFKQPNNTPPSDLKATSDFSKKVKEHLINGGHIYTTGGIFLPKGR